MSRAIVTLLLLLGLATPARATPAAVIAGAGTTTTTDGATFHGAFSSGGRAADVSFQYGPTDAYGSTTTVQHFDAPAPSTPVSATVTGLGGAPTHYRMVVVTSSPFAEVGASADQVAYRAPALAMRAPADVTRTTATLRGTVALRQAPSARVRFVYGPATTEPQDITGDGPVSTDLSGLAPGTTYETKLRVTRGGEVFETPLRSFTTEPAAERTVFVLKGRPRETLLLRPRPLVIRIRCVTRCRANTAGVVRAGERVLGRIPAPERALRLGAGDRGTIRLSTGETLRARVRRFLQAHSGREVVLTLKAAFRPARGDRFSRRIRVPVRLP